jgi:hypothetical protein
MDYSSYGNSGSSPIVVPVDEWTDVSFDTEYADPTNSHGAVGPTILLGSRQFCLDASVELKQEDSGDLTDTVVQMRVAEYKYIPKTATEPARDDLVTAGDPQNTVLVSDGIAKLAAVGHVNDTRKLRVQVRHSLLGNLSITSAKATVLSQNAGS